MPCSPRTSLRAFLTPRKLLKLVRVLHTGRCAYSRFMGGESEVRGCCTACVTWTPGPGLTPLTQTSASCPADRPGSPQQGACPCLGGGRAVLIPPAFRLGFLSYLVSASTEHRTRVRVPTTEGAPPVLAALCRALRPVWHGWGAASSSPPFPLQREARRPSSPSLAQSRWQ